MKIPHRRRIPPCGGMKIPHHRRIPPCGGAVWRCGRRCLPREGTNPPHGPRPPAPPGSTASIRQLERQPRQFHLDAGAFLDGNALSSRTLLPAGPQIICTHCSSVIERCGCPCSRRGGHRITQYDESTAAMKPLATREAQDGFHDMEMARQPGFPLFLANALQPGVLGCASIFSLSQRREAPKTRPIPAISPTHHPPLLYERKQSNETSLGRLHGHPGCRRRLRHPWRHL